jgi:hypothetical protein
MMLVDMEIALHAEVDVDQRVARELLDHVIEEADAGLDAIRAGAVDREIDRDLGLGRIAADARAAHGRFLDVARLLALSRRGATA